MEWFVCHFKVDPIKVMATFSRLVTFVLFFFPQSLPSQDIEVFDLENFKYNFVNMTAFRIVDSTNLMVKHTLRDIGRYQPRGQSILNKTNVINVRIKKVHCTFNPPSFHSLFIRPFRIIFLFFPILSFLTSAFVPHSWSQASLFLLPSLSIPLFLPHFSLYSTVFWS